MGIGLVTNDISIALDTVTFTHLKNGHSYVRERLASYVQATQQYPALTSITVFEINYGIQKELATGGISSDRAEQYKDRVNTLIRQSQILPFDTRSAELAAHVFARLSKSERQKHWRDVFIASIVAAHGFGLATQNRRDMERVSDCFPADVLLRLDIWKEQQATTKN